MGSVLFFVSKVGWFLARPLHSLLLLLLAWGFGRALGRRRLARGCLAALLIYGGLIVATPLPELALRSLENRFPAPPSLAAADLAGIIVLGGATGDGAVAESRNQVTLGGAAERLTAAVALHRAMPDKPVVVSGFSGRLRPRGWNEAEITGRLFADLGVDPAGVRFEAQSRNTAENARRSARLLGGADRPWLLVTSAWHMPRAVASFRAAGLRVLPYPVDYRTEPASLLWPRSVAGSLADAELALHEWLGLLAYYVTGRSAELFPAPQPGS
jgi:uncharacterized SAM-binding protein YcdF (DUF218 family)